MSSSFTVNNSHGLSSRPRVRQSFVNVCNITGRANNEQRVLYKFGCQHRTASVNDRLWRLASAVSSGTPLTRPLALLQNLNAAEYRNDYWAEDKDIIEDLRTPFNLTASLSRVRDAKHDVQDQKNNEYGYSNEL